MKLNPLLVQKALNCLSSSIYYFAQSIVVSPEDIADYNAMVKARKAVSSKPEKDKPKPTKADPKPEKPEKEDLKALKADLAREEKKLSREESEDEEAARPKQESGLPDKPMKQATMDEFLKGWVTKAKARPIKSAGGFAVGMGCSFQNIEHLVKAVYSNGVVLLNRKGTQYHRLVPVDQLDSLFLKDSGVSSKYLAGQKVEVGFGMRDANKASSFRPAVVISIHGQSAQIKYVDTEMTSTAKLSHLRPVKE